MAETSFECPSCESDIRPEDVLAALAYQGSAGDVLEEQQDVEMDCPSCGSEIVLGASEVIVKLSVDNATLAVFRRMAEEGDEFVENRTADLDDVVEREQRARERRKEMEKQLDELLDSL